MHGDLNQGAREKALKAFRTGEIDVLVATDVAARGIDIDDITHVINYQIPEDEQAYVHRIGRTGRAGKTGIAVTLVDWDELPRWALIDKALGLGIPDPEETYSNSPSVYADLDIPTDVSGSVGDAVRTSSKDRPKREPREAGDRERPARNRTRQRTRGGSAGTGHVENAEQDPVASDGDAAPADGSSPARRRRRRRRPSTAAPAAG